MITCTSCGFPKSDNHMDARASFLNVCAIPLSPPRRCSSPPPSHDQEQRHESSGRVSRRNMGYDSGVDKRVQRVAASGVRIESCIGMHWEEADFKADIPTWEVRSYTQSDFRFQGPTITFHPAVEVRRSRMFHYVFEVRRSPSLVVLFEFRRSLGFPTVSSMERHGQSAGSIRLSQIAFNYE